TIVGGHTEVTPGLERPIVMTTAFAIARSFVTAGGAEAGGTLMMTKRAGIVGSAILGAEAARRGAATTTVWRARRVVVWTRVAGGKEERVKSALDPLGIPVTSIGRFRPGERTLIHKRRGRKSFIRDSPADELWRVEKTSHLVST